MSIVCARLDWLRSRSVSSNTEGHSVSQFALSARQSSVKKRRSQVGAEMRNKLEECCARECETTWNLLEKWHSSPVETVALTLRPQDVSLS